MKSQGDGFAAARSAFPCSKQSEESPSGAGGSRKRRPSKAGTNFLRGHQEDSAPGQPAVKVRRTSPPYHGEDGEDPSDSSSRKDVAGSVHRVSSPSNAPPASSSTNLSRCSGGKEHGKGHDKYCHFCQHVKINMLACTTHGCTHRYCIYCLGVHLGDDTEPSTSKAWASGEWTCPTCRGMCCCSSTECSRGHRHCKAFRYRLRRADAAKMRATAAHALVSLAALVDDGNDGKEHASKVPKTSSTKPERKTARTAGARKLHPKHSTPASSAASTASGESIQAKVGAPGAGDQRRIAAESSSCLFTEKGDVVPLVDASGHKLLGLPSSLNDVALGKTPKSIFLGSPAPTARAEGLNEMAAVAALVGAAASLVGGAAQIGSQGVEMQSSAISCGDAADALSILSHAAARSDTRPESERQRCYATVSSPPASPYMHANTGTVKALLNSPLRQNGSPPENPVAQRAGSPGSKGTQQHTLVQMLSAGNLTSQSGGAKGDSGVESRMVGMDKKTIDSQSGKESSEDETPPGLLTSRSATRSGSEDNSAPSCSPPAHGSLIMRAVRKAGGGLLMSEWSADTDDEDAGLCHPA